VKKIIFLFVIAVCLLACKKTKFAPEGPTDVRVENLSDVAWLQVIVNTSGGIDTLGNIAAHAKSAYFRFDKAFNVAEISATIGGEKYSTGVPNYTYLAYIGQAKITYSVWISDPTHKVLEISHCSLDAPLDSI
jgi:hypothetical protein